MRGRRIRRHHPDLQSAASLGASFERGAEHSARPRTLNILKSRPNSHVGDDAPSKPHGRRPRGNSGAQGRSDGFCGRLRAPPIQMPVNANCRLNRLMPQVLLDNRQRYARGDHPGCAGVAQVVHSGRFGETGFHGAVACWLPAAVEELLGANGIARSVGEQKTRCGEIYDFHRSGRQADGADRFLRLRRADLWPIVAGVLPCLIDSTRLRGVESMAEGQPAAEEADVSVIARR